MAITPYALQVQTAQLPDIGNMLLRRQQMQAAQQQQQVNALALEDAMTKRQDAQALRNALAQYNPENPQSVNALMRVPGGADIADSMMKRKQEQQRYEMESRAKTMELLPKAIQNIPDTLEGYSYFYNGATQESSWLKPYLPAPSDFKPGAGGTKEQILVPFKERYARETAEGQTEGRVRAAEIAAQGRVDAAAAKANQPQRPFQIGPNLVSPTGEVIYQGTEEGPSDWQKVTDEKGQVLFYSPSTNQVRTSPGVELDKGVTPTAAQQEKQQAKEAALSGISDILNRASKAFDVLEKENAIVDPSKSVGENIAASVVSSPIGRQVGQVVGSKAQQARNELSRLGPLFVTQLKNATGLSASQLNSNVELQLFLKTIEGDDLVTARKQIELLKNMFAKGQAPKNLKEVTQKFNKMNREAGIKDDAEPSDAGPPPGVDAEDWQFMTPEQKALWETEE